MKPLVDKMLNFLMTKKLFVLLIGTHMEYFTENGISDNWLILAGTYISIQGILDIWKTKFNSNGI